MALHIGDASVGTHKLGKIPGRALNLGNSAVATSSRLMFTEVDLTQRFKVLCDLGNRNTGPAYDKVQSWCVFPVCPPLSAKGCSRTDRGGHARGLNRPLFILSLDTCSFTLSHAVRRGM